MELNSRLFAEREREPKSENNRGAPRVALVLRPAKLVCSNAEYFCLIRDISAGGVRLKLFHPLPTHEIATLELRNGHCFTLKPVWRDRQMAGYTFLEDVDVKELIEEASSLPKRQLRLNLILAGAVRSGTTTVRATIKNLAQQGAGVECNLHLAVDQLVMLSFADLPEIAAKVRWRRDGQYGLLFEETFTLHDFAVLADRLQ